MAKATVAGHSTETELRQLFAPTAPRRGWENNEQYLVSLWRKLTDEERLHVMCYAERMALARITARLERDRQRHRKSKVVVDRSL